MSVPTQKKIDELKADDFLNDDVSVNDLILLDNKRKDEIRKGCR